jgi:hypothetical protein
MAKQTQKHSCNECIFKERIPGDAHIKCTAEWSKEDFKGKDKKINYTPNQWSFFFPHNFDSHWIKFCKKKQTSQS